nr:ABC transporter permease [uncultured Cohaesibacter sp.]
MLPIAFLEVPLLPLALVGKLDGIYGMLKDAFIVQARVIGALILRETRVRYGRSKLGYLWAFTGPLVWVVAFTAMHEAIDAVPAYGDNIGLFIALGIIPYRLYQSLATQCGNAITANIALLNFPIVKELDTIIARGILEVATFFIIFIVIILGLILFTGAPLPYDIPKMAEAFLGLCLFGFGVGVVNAVISEKLPSWMNIFNMFSLPIFWVSGIFFSLESIPAVIRDILLWNPILHGIEAMRMGYYQNYRGSYIDLPYLYGLGLFLVLAGLASERAIRVRSS